MTSDQPTRPNVEMTKTAPSRVSLVWLLPMAALLFAAWMLWQAYADRGPLITINFESASGVTAGETRVLSNDVAVGLVESVGLSEDLRTVIVQVRMNPEVAPYIDTDTQFWVVNARINTTEISGLSTLLSGAYIEVDWDDSPGTREDEFYALLEPPLTQRGTPGMRITLDAEEAGYIYVGSPVFYRQLEVGRVERRRLSTDGQKVQFDIFVEAPFHRFIYAGTRFFGVSGVEATVNSDGASVRVESVAALFTGGIAFETDEQGSQGEPLLRNNTEFPLYGSRSEARDSLFDAEGDDRFRYMVELEGSTKGLKVGSPVEFNGIRIGRVIAVDILPPTVDGQVTRVNASLQLQPRRLGITDIDKAGMDQLLQTFIDKGLRAQLASGNLLTGALLIKMVYRDDAPAEQLDTSTVPYATLPTTASSVEAITADVETLIKNLSALPLDSLVSSATDLLRNAGNLVGSEEVTSLPAQLSDSLASLGAIATQIESATNDLPRMMLALTAAAENAEAVLAGVSPDSEIYIELSATVSELRGAAKSIARFSKVLEDKPNALITGR